MSAKPMSRSKAVLLGIAYTTALPLAFAVVSVIYALIVGING